MKKLLTAMMVGVLAVGSLAGCSGGGEKEEKKSADAFYIGGIGPTTGAAAIYGNAAKNGAQIAVDEINAAGGINGVPIEYNFQDDQHDAEKSVNAYNTLKDWGMQILYGTVTTGPCIAVADKTAQDNMFQLTPSASSTDVIVNDNAFQVCFTDPNQGIASAQYIAQNNLAEKIAIIYDSSDVYSSGIEEKFVEEAKTQNLNVVSVEAFTADSKTDFQTQLQKAQDAGADLVFLPIYYQEASIILKQADTMGYAPTFFGVDGLDGLLTVENFDTSLAEGVMLLTPFAADAQDEATVNFVTSYQEKYGETPNQFAADGYDSIYTIKAAIEHAGVTPDMDASSTCDALKAAMTEITVNGLTGDELTWEATGEVSKAPKAVVIQNGAYVGME
ncbi:MAG: ABC transporter substrate-binding protein [Eubacteriales bacterium]|nr:ABC transporter substrate-binding protein [Eubacteriales bacterium]